MSGLAVTICRTEDHRSGEHGGTPEQQPTADVR